MITTTTAAPTATPLDRIANLVHAHRQATGDRREEVQRLAVLATTGIAALVSVELDVADVCRDLRAAEVAAGGSALAELARLLRCVVEDAAAAVPDTR